MKAQDVMSREVVTVTPDSTILHAARLMLQRKFSGLPVVDANDTLVGMVTEGDFCAGPKPARCAVVRAGSSSSLVPGRWRPNIRMRRGAWWPTS